MTKLKSTKKYYFSVEGETEQWYLQWLQKQINDTGASQYKVSLDCQVQKNPLKRAKSLVVTAQTENVLEAVNRAKTIMQRNHENGYVLHQYKGYRYYKENPFLAIEEAIEKILKVCRLMQS